MERALAVVEADETTKELVREAGELAAGVDADLKLVHVTSEEEYDDHREDLESIPNADVQYTIGQATDGAKNFAKDIGREVLEGLAVEWEPLGRVGDEADTIVETAEDEGCDYIFLTGRKRSPAGKAVFGDVAQQVILGFDGAVTVVTV